MEMGENAANQPYNHVKNLLHVMMLVHVTNIKKNDFLILEILVWTTDNKLQNQLHGKWDRRNLLISLHSEINSLFCSTIYYFWQIPEYIIMCMYNCNPTKTAHCSEIFIRAIYSKCFTLQNKAIPSIISN